MARSVSVCLSWRDATFFGQHRTSALQLKSSHHKIFESHATGCAGDTGTWVAIVGPTSPWVFEPSTTTPKLTTTQPWVRMRMGSSCTWSRESSPIARVLRNHSSRDLSVHGFFRVLSKQTKKEGQCFVRTARRKRSKSAGLCTAMHAPVIWRSVTCRMRLPVYANEPLSGWKIVPSNRIFSRSDGDKFQRFANRSTLNSCNFVVSWRIELKFVALESWRVSFFNNVSFVAKRWGLKNHPAVPS